MTVSRWATVLILLAFLGSSGGGPVLAADPPATGTGAEKAQKKQKDEKQGPKEGQEAGAVEAPHVYTNDDLESLPPSPASPTRGAAVAAARATGEAQDPLQWMEEGKAQRSALAAKITSAQERVTAAEARVRELEKRQQAIRNPYLPRPQISSEQAKTWSKMGSAERLKSTEDELAAARKAAEDAKADLQKLRSSAEVH
jgi:hypothetical protein